MKTVGRLATITLQHALPRVVTLAVPGEQVIVRHVASGPFGTPRAVLTVLHATKLDIHSCYAQATGRLYTFKLPQNAKNIRQRLICAL